MGRYNIQVWVKIEKGTFFSDHPLVGKNCVEEKSHGGEISFGADTIRDTDWDVIETVLDQESTIPQLQGGITVQKDAPNEDADWDEGATVAQSKDDGRYETMKPV